MKTEEFPLKRFFDMSNFTKSLCFFGKLEEVNQNKPDDVLLHSATVSDEEKNVERDKRQFYLIKSSQKPKMCVLDGFSSNGLKAVFLTFWTPPTGRKFSLPFFSQVEKFSNRILTTHTVQPD